MSSKSVKLSSAISYEFHSMMNGNVKPLIRKRKLTYRSKLKILNHVSVSVNSNPELIWKLCKLRMTEFLKRICHYLKKDVFWIQNLVSYESNTLLHKKTLLVCLKSSNKYRHSIRNWRSKVLKLRSGTITEWPHCVMIMKHKSTR